MCAVITYKRRRKYLSDASASPMLHSVMVPASVRFCLCHKRQCSEGFGQTQSTVRSSSSLSSSRSTSLTVYLRSGRRPRQAAALSRCPWTSPNRPEACRQRKAARSCGSVSMGTGREQRRAGTACVCVFFVERRESWEQSMNEREG